MAIGLVLHLVSVLGGSIVAVRYGAGALAGVVSLETKDASDFLDEGDPFAVNQALEYKSNGEGVQSSTFLAFAPDAQFNALVGLIYDDSEFQEGGDGEDILGTKTRAAHDCRRRCRFSCLCLV